MDARAFLEEIQCVANAAHIIVQLGMRLMPAENKMGMDAIPDWRMLGFDLSEAAVLLSNQCVCTHPECDVPATHHYVRQVDADKAGVLYACVAHKDACAFLACPEIFVRAAAERRLAAHYGKMWLELPAASRLDGVDRLFEWTISRIF